MGRDYAPTALDTIITKVKGKAQQFIRESPDKPATWGRTYTEPDRKVYTTAEKSRQLIDKWERLPDMGERYITKGSSSSSGSLVDLKLQLKEAWGGYKEGTSPFVYHIPIDKHEPRDVRREADRRRQMQAAAAARATKKRT